MLFGKLFIALLCTFTGYIVITSVEKFSEGIYSPFMPTLVLFLANLRYFL